MSSPMTHPTCTTARQHAVALDAANRLKLGHPDFERRVLLAVAYCGQGGGLFSVTGLARHLLGGNGVPFSRLPRSEQDAIKDRLYVALIDLRGRDLVRRCGGHWQASPTLRAM